MPPQFTYYSVSPHPHPLLPSARIELLDSLSYRRYSSMYPTHTYVHTHTHTHQTLYLVLDSVYERCTVVVGDGLRLPWWWRATGSPPHSHKCIVLHISGDLKQGRGLLDARGLSKPFPSKLSTCLSFLNFQQRQPKCGNHLLVLTGWNSETYQNETHVFFPRAAPRNVICVASILFKVVFCHQRRGGRNR